MVNSQPYRVRVPSAFNRFAIATVILINHRSCSPRCPATDHLRPAVSAVVLWADCFAIHAKRVPVNPERLMADAARNAVLIPSGLRVVVMTRHEHQALLETYGPVADKKKAVTK